MQKPAEKTGEFFNLISDWQDIEGRAMEDSKEVMAKTDNSFIKSMMGIIKYNAEKNCHVQQMVLDSVSMEAAHLSPDDLNVLSSHLNSYLESEERELKLAEEAFQKSELIITRHLLSYLMDDVKNHNKLIRQLEDELKIASIPTSASSKIYATASRGA